ncbi:peptidase S58, DmpA [Alkaliphilus metalliredigens QYMF]|uniref:Peptidase S58, DmpA n=1 Tax=Alkaliphilus metalliredigens (strain QYMF) TaxID=293826 RepID=A6TPD1_ALKMQ|nr:P1 family peptidase [Alkaliphilus metalliredigens]ABR48049.1 peptidase S58, DmpA [Alkaliphilus metalliredigens QYMF]
MKRIRDYGIRIGKGRPGPHNKITDVLGVTVGHATIKEGDVQTGVTAIYPHKGNLFKEKVVASSHVINGFGKTQGLLQVQELGAIETPILLTNTLNIGIVCDGLIEYMLEENKEIGVTTGTVNPIIGECNDGYLNDIRGRHVQKHHVFEALEKDTVDFDEGSVGAGTGMTAYGLKGGIGSASRRIRLSDREYTVGVLVLSNFGKLENLLLDGRKIGKWIDQKQKIGETQKQQETEDKGSVIIVLATDAPLSDRQLNRISKRVTVGLARTGSEIGHGSGDIVIAFSTKNLIAHESAKIVTKIECLAEEKLNEFFSGTIEAVEESVINSMITAETTVGRNQHCRVSLREYLDEYENEHK